VKRLIETLLALAAATALAVAAPQTPVAAAKDGAKPGKSVAAAKAPKAPKAQAAAKPTAAEIADAKAKGLVWVNTNTKVFHKDGERYGATRNGKFMTEDDAVKAGFHAAKTGAGKKAAAPGKKTAAKQ
jgi:hypothetical protein